MSSRSLYILGAPATGKSTLARAVVARLGLAWAPDRKVFRELWVTPLTDAAGAEFGLSFGKERGSFSGTDALSMSVLPRALEWLAVAELPPFVLGEGMRLSSPKFLVELDRRAPVTVVYLHASETERAARRAGRANDRMSDKFVAAAATRAANTADVMEALGFPVHRIDAGSVDPEQAAAEVCSAAGLAFNQTRSTKYQGWAGRPPLGTLST